MLSYGFIASLLFPLSSTALFDSFCFCFFCLFCFVYVWFCLVLFVFVLHCWFVFFVLLFCVFRVVFDLYSMLV